MSERKLSVVRWFWLLFFAGQVVAAAALSGMTQNGLNVHRLLLLSGTLGKLNLQIKCHVPCVVPTTFFVWLNQSSVKAPRWICLVMFISSGWGEKGRNENLIKLTIGRRIVKLSRCWNMKKSAQTFNRTKIRNSLFATCHSRHKKVASFRERFAQTRKKSEESCCFVVWLIICLDMHEWIIMVTLTGNRKKNVTWLEKSVDFDP